SLSLRTAGYAKYTQLCGPRHSFKRLAGELPLWFSLLEGSRLEAIHRYRLGPTHSSLLSLAVHGNHAGPIVSRGSGLLTGSTPCRRLRPKPAGYGSLDHAFGQPHRCLGL